jgi:hypothetical protein
MPAFEKPSFSVREITRSPYYISVGSLQVARGPGNSQDPVRHFNIGGEFLPYKTTLYIEVGSALPQGRCPLCNRAAGTLPKGM